MITTETINNPTHHKLPAEFGGGEPKETNLLARIAEQFGLTADEAAKQLGIPNRNKKRTPERPQAECHQCGQTYAVQDKSCMEKQDVCPACRDQQAAPARALVHGREKVGLDAQARTMAEAEAKRKDADDERIMKMAAAVIAASKEAGKK